MEQQALLSADYLDILFDRRNKAYGGYELRNHYNRRIRTSLFIMLSFAGALSLYSLLKPLPTEIVPKILTPPCTLTDLTMEIKHPEIIIEPPAAAKVKAEGLSVPKIVQDDKVPDQPPADTKPAEPAGKVGQPDGTALTDSKTPAGGNTVTTITIPPPAEPAKPLGYAEEMPAFEGSLISYLGSNLKYPPIARENNIQGNVVVRFVVNEDGSIGDVNILRSIGGGCDEEAMRVVKHMPRWKAGKQNGKPVKVFFTLPILFKLQ